MRLRELIFQGVLGNERPQRLKPEGSLARLQLPPGMSVYQVHDLLIACLYPDELALPRRRRLQISDDAKLAVVLEVRDRVYRVIRRDEPETVKFQRKSDGDYEDVTSGAEDVQEILHQKLGIPDPRVFFPLHLWRFEPTGLPGAAADLSLDDETELADIVDDYRTALKVEAVEDEINELEHRIDENRRELGRGREVEDKLEAARERLADIGIGEVTDEDIDFLDEKEDKLVDLDAELRRLREQEGKELDQIDELLPDPPHRSPILLVGIGVAVGALMVSFLFHDSYRLVGLASIPGWAVATFELFRYYHNRGRANLRKVRLQSIRRRINQLLEEKARIRERADHVMYRAGFEDEATLRVQLPEYYRLRNEVEQYQHELEAIRNDSDYRRARDELDSMQQRLEELHERHAEMPDLPRNSFQLEQDLEKLGVDPERVKEDDEAVEEETEQWDLDSPFAWLRHVAGETGQWDQDGLTDSARSTWSKICGHVLSERFDDLDLTADGQLQVEALTDEQLELWQNTRSSEVHAVVAALALALHINLCGSGDRRMLTSVWMAEPSEAMTPGHADKFDSVFRSAAKKSQIVICESDP